DNTASGASDSQLKELEKELVSKASQLSNQRQQLAQQLETDIKTELKDLYMEKADFQVKFEKSKFNAQGNQTV
ncbi:hypothetical protein L0P10_19895, partial [Eggerthella lenta]|nr:hypothetical protein [Eggerthella lenta]